MRFEAGPEFASLIKAAALVSEFGRTKHGRSARVRLLVTGRRLRVEAVSGGLSLSFTGEVALTSDAEGTTALVSAEALVATIPSKVTDRKTATYRIEPVDSGTLHVTRSGYGLVFPVPVFGDDEPEIGPEALGAGPGAEGSPFLLPGETVRELQGALLALSPADRDSYELRDEWRTILLDEGGGALAVGRHLAIRLPKRKPNDEAAPVLAVPSFADLAQAVKVLAAFPGPKGAVRARLWGDALFLTGFNVAAIPEPVVGLSIRLVPGGGARFQSVITEAEKRGTGPRYFMIKDADQWREALGAAIKASESPEDALRIEAAPGGSGLLVSTTTGAHGDHKLAATLPATGTITADPPEEEKTDEGEGSKGAEETEGTDPPLPCLEFPGAMLLSLLNTTFGHCDEVRFDYDLAAQPVVLSEGPGMAGAMGRVALLMPIVRL